MLYKNGSENQQKAMWAQVVAALQTAYPTKGFLDSKAAISLWYQMLQDIPMQQVNDAAQRYIMEEHFPPTIADIRKRCFAQQAAALPDWEQGWAETMAAIHRWGYMRESEALASLNPITAEVVRRLGYQALCFSDNPDGDRIAFREIHSRYTERQKQNMQLPDSLKVERYQIQQNDGVLQIEEMQRNMHFIGSDQRTEGYAGVAANRIRERIGE